MLPFFIKIRDKHVFGYNYMFVFIMNVVLILLNLPSRYKHPYKTNTKFDIKAVVIPEVMYTIYITHRVSPKLNPKL